MGYINKYNNINVVIIAKSIIIDLFEKGYEEIYDSIIDDIIYRYDSDGNEIEEEIIAQPVEVIHHIDCTKEIKDLLLHEGIQLDEVCANREEMIFEPIYIELKNIYKSALNVSVNGENYIKSDPIIQLDILPEEYIDLYFDFFESYNNKIK